MSRSSLNSILLENLWWPWLKTSKNRGIGICRHDHHCHIFLVMLCKFFKLSFCIISVAKCGSNSFFSLHTLQILVRLIFCKICHLMYWVIFWKLCKILFWIIFKKSAKCHHWWRRWTLQDSAAQRQPVHLLKTEFRNNICQGEGSVQDARVCKYRFAVWY